MAPRDVAELAMAVEPGAGLALQLEGVIKVYREGDIETVALRGVDLTVEAGQFVAIMGRSGSGKSTLLNLIAGSDRPTAGRVVVDGVEIGRADEAVRAPLRGAQVGIVFQDNNLVPFLDVAENVKLGAQLAGRSADRASIDLLLDRVGLAERRRHRPAQLSGGEQQRAGLACVLAGRPRLLLADEITGELDSMSAGLLLGLLRRLHAEEAPTILLVTHDPAVAAVADRLVELRDGRVTADRLQA